MSKELFASVLKLRKRNSALRRQSDFLARALDESQKEVQKAMLAEREACAVVAGEEIDDCLRNDRSFDSAQRILIIIRARGNANPSRFDPATEAPQHDMMWEKVVNWTNRG